MHKGQVKGVPKNDLSGDPRIDGRMMQRMTRERGIVNWKQVTQDRDGWRRANGKDACPSG